MKTNMNLPVELDAPEKQHIGIGIFYGLVTFFALPYFVYFLLADLQDPYIAGWFEFGYHLINFVVVFSLFKEYLMDSIFMFRLQLKEYLFNIKMGLFCVAGIVAVVYVAVNLCDLPWLFTTLIAAFPISEMEILYIGGDLVYYSPLASFLCAVVLAPLTVTCLFYCVSFAPAFRVRPWLGYVAVAVWLGFTHINNAVTYWDITMEIALFILQLPIHMIACWAYKKTNNVFSPMAVLTLTNLLAWVYLFIYTLLNP